jgi:hypothetical protein
MLGKQSARRDVFGSVAIACLDGLLATRIDVRWGFIDQAGLAGCLIGFVPFGLR